MRPEQRPRRLAQADASWIESALRHVEYGEVRLIVHQGSIVRIDTTVTRSITKGVDARTELD